MFYAYGDTRTPVLCSAVNLASFFGLCVALMGSLGHSAIALANSFASMAQLLLLLLLLARRLGALGLREVLAAGARFALASLVMALVVSDLASLGDWSRGGNDPRNLALYALTAAFGLAVYAAASYVLGSPELQQIASALRRRPAPG
jgi:putative peptidoglycan lipid II flippase